MHDVLKLVEKVQAKFPDLSAEATKHVKIEGQEPAWTVDFTQRGTHIVVQWTARGFGHGGPFPFGVSLLTDDTGFGEGPDQVFEDVDGALKRIIELMDWPYEDENGGDGMGR